MSNVLPQEVRQRVWWMYCARFVTAASLILLAVALLAGVALMPSYLTLHSGENSAPQDPSAGASRQTDRDAIVHAQALLGALSPLVSATTTSVLVADAVAVRPATVQIFHITATAGHPGTIVLSGAAGGIKAIGEYQAALRENRNFSGVSVPVADLAGTGNGQFSITLSADF